MPKLNLVIADEDEDYAANLLAYLAENYSDKFKVTIFTKRDYLAQYLKQGRFRIDILLTTVEMYEKGMNLMEHTVLVYLGSGFIDAGYSAYKHMDKYRHADLLASDIFEYYAEKSNNELDMIKKRSEAKIISVYSPSGGVGKTTIAASLSITASKKGLSAFYLNLEYCQSTTVFFNGVNTNNLSTVIYHIRQKSSNLPVRIDSSCCTDNELGVNFFLPPDCTRDIGDLSEEDLSTLVNILKNSGKFDIVIIDLPCSFDMKSKYALECSDAAVFIAEQDKLSRARLANLINEIERSDANTESLKVYQKHFALNKYIGGISDESQVDAGSEFAYDIKIPYINGVDLSKDLNRILMVNSEYANSIRKLLENLITAN